MSESNAFLIFFLFLLSTRSLPVSSSSVTVSVVVVATAAAVVGVSAVVAVGRQWSPYDDVRVAVATATSAWRVTG